MSTTSIRLNSFFSDVSHAKLKYKLKDLSNSGHFNKEIDSTQLLLQTCSTNTLVLNIPETLVPGVGDKRVFLYTDSDGTVRTTTGKE